MIASRRIRDPIHGFIHLDDTECRIVDTPLFQRLRSISQLAMAKLVYPGALHTRFDHTLGVFHVASKMCVKLGIDPDHTKLICHAALLHDLGHGPFSHVSETILDHLSPPGLGDEAGQKDKIHELITARIILEHPDLKVLPDHEREDVKKLLKNGLGDQLYKQVISGPLDADKQDYLLRDSYFCGVKYGEFDLRQLRESLIVDEEDGEQLLMVDENGLHALEQFVLAKYYLTTQVYRHKVRMVSDCMLVRALQLGVQTDNIEFLRKLYCYDAEDSGYLDNYLSWNDHRLTAAILAEEHKDHLAGQLFRRLMQRRLLKVVARIPLGPLIKASGQSEFEQVFKSLRSEVESRTAEYLKTVGFDDLQNEFVIAHHYRIENVRKQAANSEKSIRIRKSDRIENFETASTLFQSIDEKMKENHLIVFAPVIFDDRIKHRRIQQQVEEMLSIFLSVKLSPQKELSFEQSKP